MEGCMTRKQRRGVLIGVGVAVLMVAVGLVLFALRDSIVFFHTPSELAEKPIPAGQRFRLGGLVADGSVKRGEGTKVEFVVTDTLKTIPVVMLTSSREEQDLIRSYKLGANAYVVKPVDFRAFIDAVRHLGAFWAVVNQPPPGGTVFKA